MSGLGVVGVMGVSVPATMAAVDTSARNSLFGNLYNIAKDAYEKASEKFKGFETTLEGEYTSKWNESKESVDQIPNNVSEEYTKGKEWVKGASDLIQEKAENANYYGFTFGYVVRQLFTHIPTILTDTAIDLIDSEAKNEQNLLSVGKIMMMMSSDKKEEFLEGMLSAAKKHPNMFENINYQDAQGVVKILKNVNYDTSSIDNFLSGIKKNSENLENSYSCSTQFLIHLLIGKTNVESIKNKSTTLKTTIEELKTTLEGIEGINNDSLTKFKEQLDSISKLENLDNPCSSTEQS